MHYPLLAVVLGLFLCRLAGGWGGHNLAFGGAVDGGQVVGAMPNYASCDNHDDAGDDDGSFTGRMIPQISVNQYGVTL